MTLFVSNISAVLERNTDPLKPMDPYLIMGMGSITRQTKVMKSSGQTPVWPGEFVFQNPDTFAMTMTIMDQDNFNDDFVAEGAVDLSNIKTKPNQNERIECVVRYNGDYAGKVIIQIRYEPN